MGGGTGTCPLCMLYKNVVGNHNAGIVQGKIVVFIQEKRFSSCITVQGSTFFCVFRRGSQAAVDVQRCLCTLPPQTLEAHVKLSRNIQHPRVFPGITPPPPHPNAFGFSRVLPSYPFPRRPAHASRRVSTTVNSSRRGCSSTTLRSSSGGARRGGSPLAISISTRRRRDKTSAWRTRCRGCNKGPTPGCGPAHAAGTCIVVP